MVCDSGSLIALGVAPQLAQSIGWKYSTVAALGSAITDAAQCQSRLVNVTGGDGTVGVLAPKNAPMGSISVIYNNSASNLLIYPQDTSHKFNGGTAGNAVTIATYTAAILIPISATDCLAFETTAI